MSSNPSDSDGSNVIYFSSSISAISVLNRAGLSGVSLSAFSGPDHANSSSAAEGPARGSISSAGGGGVDGASNVYCSYIFRCDKAPL